MTRNTLSGDRSQIISDWRSSGLANVSAFTGRLDPNQLWTLSGNTQGVTVGYTPTSWWSHQLVVGSDANVTGSSTTQLRYYAPFDTTLTFSQSFNTRTSEQYTSNMRIAITAIAQANITLGADRWQTQSSSLSATPLALTGTLASPSITRDPAQKNSGAFMQTQIAVADALFFTYGLRAEWNPTYGADAQPNYAPRYGVTYTRDVGAFTTKLRVSYGRATRPPAQTLKQAVALTPNGNVTTVALREFGPLNVQLANDALQPEYQQGVDGGLELYYGRHASLTITRYNQTVDNLIAAATTDSVRSLLPNPTTASSTYRDAQGYGFYYQSQYLNLGSIRNEGWELQNTVTLGPLAVQNTYSWTKSRVIGITPGYRSLFASNLSYQPGASFTFLPEHTWGSVMTYATAASTVSLGFNGNGQLFKARDFLYYNSGSVVGWRDPNTVLHKGLPTGYRSIGHGYTMLDLNMLRRVTSRIEGNVQIQNLNNIYQQDSDIQYAVIGRQSKVGVRVRF